MGTPFIAHLEPTPLPWDRSLPSHEQPNLNSLPRTFLDAMSVREQVYVVEQGIPQSNEFDSDDARSAHWVIYASVNQTISPAVTDPTTGEVLQPRQSETKSLPIGTIRLVPFPHPPHPRNGGVYVDGELINAGEPVSRVAQPPSSSPSPLPRAEETIVAPLNPLETHRTLHPLPPFAADRPTTFHDGIEPYIKLGRLAVLSAFRGRGIAQQLIRAALDWIASHPSYFDPNPLQHGFENLGVDTSGTVPRWRGLVGIHAQEVAVKSWAKAGFVVDEGMGKWMEEGIPHVGMFLRVPLEGEKVNGNGEAK